MQMQHKIKAVTVRAVCVPMATPHKTASGEISESPLVLTDITIDNGIVGHSMVFTYTRAALTPTADLVRNMQTFVEGRLLAPKVIENDMSKRFRLLGTQGLVGMALAAIDMALWDALARCCNLPLAQLLGAQGGKMPAYGGVGYDGVKGSAQAAEAWVEQGFKGVKAKIGYPTVGDDIDVVSAIRRAVGDDITIMVDYNQCLSPVEAVQRIKALEKEGLAWVEEPTLAHDYKGHAFISRETSTPIQCGENWWGAQDMQHAIDAKASDYMMLDVMKIGGVTGWMRAAALAQTHGIMLSSHLWPEVSTHLLCVTPTAHWLEYIDWWNPILQQPLQINNGEACIEENSGSGVEWNEEAVKKYCV